MCGIAAGFGSWGIEKTLSSVEGMLHVQAHRGPDSAGTWCGAVHGIAAGLGTRRLSILDVTDAANQPMVSDDGRFVLIYNGEIFNYLELRDELIAAGHRFRSSGDTEVVLNALIAWGSDALPRFNGMWGLVLLDTRSGEVLISRDRFGIKPLYTCSGGQMFFVSSEIKGILDVADRKFKVSAQVASAFLLQDILCSGTATFFEGIEEFPAGHFAISSIENLGKKPLAPKRYWKTPSAMPQQLSEEELIESIRTTFIDAVRLRLRSDVSVGILLSGGIDSSAIAAAVHHIDPSRTDIRLISGTSQTGYDEQPFIDIMGTYLGRDVEKVSLDYPPSRALDLIREASWFNDEPIGSFSTVAHFLIMQHASNMGVTVLLSGQGADELLCGYKKYLGFYLQELWRSGQFVEAAKLLGGFLKQGTLLTGINYQEGKRYLPDWLRVQEDEIRGPALVGNVGPTHVGLNGGGVIGRAIEDIEHLSVPALVHYEDRMSMAVGEEVRLPFLDYRLVGLLSPVPTKNKLRHGWTKWIFRKAMEPLLPEAIAWRKDKQYFKVPQEEWLRGELREDITSLIQSDWVSESLGLIDKGKFRARYDAYLGQRTNTSRFSVFGIKDIFSPISLELWARRFGKYLCSYVAVSVLLLDCVT